MIYVISPYTGDRRRNYPTSLMHLVYYLRRQGLAAEVLDCDGLRWSHAKLIGFLEEHPPTVLGVTSYSITRFASYDLLKRLGQRFPGVPLVVGGRHFAALAEETLERFSEVDAVVRGEGEVTFGELCRALTEGGALADIPGVTWRDGARIVTNPDRPVPRDLDELQFGVDEPIRGDFSPLYRMSKSPEHKRSLGVKTGRGCVGRCIFCCTSTTKLRFRTADRVLDEIEALAGRTGCRFVTFLDETLTANQHYLSSFCQAILDRRLDIHWTCNSRVDIDFELLGLMKEAGCLSVHVGLESGSPKVLQIIKKHINLDQFFTMARNCHQLGINVWVFAMVSFPDETEADALETLRVITEAAPYIYKPGVQLTRVYPDAALYTIARDGGVLPPGFDWFSPYRNDLSPQFGGTSSPGSNIGDNIPFYLDTLGVDFLKWYFGQAAEMEKKYFTYRGDYLDAIRSTLWRTFFDWRHEGLAKKISRTKRALTLLPHLKSYGKRSKS